jgi:hypothetical protein
MNINNDGIPKVLESVFPGYLSRFENILWDTRFITLAVLHTDLAQVSKRLNDAPELFEAVGRLTQEGHEGYNIFKFSLTFYWAEIESFIEMFLSSWLTHARPPATLKIFDKIGITQSVGEFERLSRSEVMALYVQGLKQKVGKGSEIKTFFAALDEIGLKECDGEKKKYIEHTLTELQQIRNVMVHRGGIVDKRMITACPWLKSRPEIEVGKLYPLTIEVTQGYGRHMLDLVNHVLDRVQRLVLTYTET